MDWKLEVVKRSKNTKLNGLKIMQSIQSKFGTGLMRQSQIPGGPHLSVVRPRALGRFRNHNYNLPMEEGAKPSP